LGKALMKRRELAPRSLIRDEKEKKKKTPSRKKQLLEGKADVVTGKGGEKKET